MMSAKQEGVAALDARLEYLRRVLETESESNLLVANNAGVRGADNPGEEKIVYNCLARRDRRPTLMGYLGEFMRAALCIFIVLFGFTNIGPAAEDDKGKKQKEKPIQLPSLDFSGYSGKFTADQSRVWETQDLSSQYQARQAESQPYFGLKLLRPLE